MKFEILPFMHTMKYRFVPRLFKLVVVVAVVVVVVVTLTTKS